MLGRHFSYFSYALAAALALCVCADSAVARAGNPFAEPFIVYRSMVPTPLLYETHWATTLYYATQTSRLLLPEPVSVQTVLPVYFGSAVSLAISTGGSTFGQSESLFPHKDLGSNAARVLFASGINDADADDRTKESAESSALFYSATNAPNASSENFIGDTNGQMNTGRSSASRTAAPSAAGLFAIPAQ